jgi:hypothetical protein
MRGLTKDRYGTYHARKKVPKDLEQAVAQVIGSGKSRQVWLKRSLRTKSVKEANLRCKPVLTEFDRILARAQQAVEAVPVRATLGPKEISAMAKHHYATRLADDARARRQGASILAHYNGTPERDSRRGLTDDELTRIDISMR